MQRTKWRASSRRGVGAAAAVPIIFGGALAAAAPPASAAPCAQWMFPQELHLFQDDGWEITIPVAPAGTPGRAEGEARYSKPDKPMGDWNYGPARGGMKGPNNFEISVDWANGTTGVYKGTVYADGIATGSSMNTERSTGKLTLAMGFKSNAMVCAPPATGSQDAAVDAAEQLIDGQFRP